MRHCIQLKHKKKACAARRESDTHGRLKLPFGLANMKGVTGEPGGGGGGGGEGEQSGVEWLHGGLPGVDSTASITLPGIVVTNVVDDHILIRLGRHNIPGVLIMQVVIASIVQHRRIGLLQGTTKTEIICNRSTYVTITVHLTCS